jgi:antitoxin VapB
MERGVLSAGFDKAIKDTEMTELDTKLQKIKELLRRHSLEGLSLRRADSFAWATCGVSSSINLTDTYGIASLFFTPTGRYVITDNIEAARLQQEEHLPDQGWEFCIAPWYEMNGSVGRLSSGLKIGADTFIPGTVNLSVELSRLRAAFTPQECDRFRGLSESCAQAMDAAIRAVRPGMTERHIAVTLAHEALSRGVEPIVNLIATDERIFRFRHPLPTEKTLERYAMLVLCGRKWGLVCSITRLVHFGVLPEDLRIKAEAVAHIDARLIDATRPGRKLRQVFAEAIEGYKEYGYPDEWQLHHQGGPVGYEPREFLATPSTEDEVSAGQVYAWNPSITGAKSEDTILVGRQENEVLTKIPAWPTIEVKQGSRLYERPAILEIR